MPIEPTTLSLAEWLRHHRKSYGLICIFIFIFGFSFDLARQNWLFALFVFIVTCPVVILATWAKGRYSAWWAAVPKRWRRFLNCAALALLWVLTAWGNRNEPDGVVWASIETVIVLAFWGLYRAFSRTVDGVWVRVRRKFTH